MALQGRRRLFHATGTPDPFAWRRESLMPPGSPPVDTYLQPRKHGNEIKNAAGLARGIVTSPLRRAPREDGGEAPARTSRGASWDVGLVIQAEGEPPPG